MSFFRIKAKKQKHRNMRRKMMRRMGKKKNTRSGTIPWTQQSLNQRTAQIATDLALDPKATGIVGYDGYNNKLFILENFNSVAFIKEGRDLQFEFLLIKCQSSHDS